MNRLLTVSASVSARSLVVRCPALTTWTCRVPSSLHDPHHHHHHHLPKMMQMPQMRSISVKRMINNNHKSQLSKKPDNAERKTTTPIVEEQRPTRAASSITEEEFEHIRQKRHDTPMWRWADWAFGMIGLLIVLLALYNLSEGRSCIKKPWKPTSGTILSSRLWLWNHNIMARVTYEYFINGKRYTNSRIRAGNFYRIMEPLYAIGMVPNFAKGQKVQVFVDPDHPRRSALMLPSWMYIQNCVALFGGIVLTAIFAKRRGLMFPHHVTKTFPRSPRQSVL